MSRPQLEVADIIRSAGTDFIERNRHWLRWTHIKVLRAIARCRTAALGGHIDQCTRCGHRAIFFFKQKTAYDIGLGIPAEPLFRSKSGSAEMTRKVSAEVDLV